MERVTDADASAAERRGPVSSHYGAHFSVAADDKAEDLLPLSLTQQHFWSLDKFQDILGAAYHVIAGSRLEGELNRGVLQSALDALVERHAALRTRFLALDGEPAQQILPKLSVPIGEEQFGRSSGDDVQKALNEWCRREAMRPFDLSAGVLIRCSLLSLAHDEHVLLIIQHPIISDAWSTGLLLRELWILYGAMHRGEPNPLVPLDVRFVDFVIWQRQSLRGEVLQKQMEFWKAHLAGAPALLDLPTDRPRPAVRSYAGDRLAFELPHELREGIGHLSQRHGVTLFHTLLAGWAALLCRLSGQADLVIGVSAANRQRREFQALIGCFADILALRLGFDDDPSVAGLLAEVRTITQQAEANLDLPFARVVEALRPERSMSRNPIFQAAFAWEEAAQDPASSVPGLSVTKINPQPPGTRFDLCLSLRDRHDRIEAVLEYATDLFDRATIERMSAQLLCVLNGMAADDRQRVSALNLLSVAQREQLLQRFAPTQVHYSEEKLVHELFEEQAARTPDALAVVFEGESISYGQLNARANQLARYLRERGVGADQLVGICMERSLGLVVGLLAILKSGGAYLPLDPSYSMERLAYMLNDAAPQALLIQEQLRGRLPQTSVEVISLDRDWPQIAHRSPDNFAADSRDTHSGHLAYVIYTSGSTGNPKGVMVEHANVVRLFRATEQWFDFNERDVWTLFHSVAFDFSVWELWGALLYGGRVVVVPLLTARSPAEFYRLVCDERVTVLNQTPAAFARFIDAQAESGRAENAEKHHSLRFIIFGGEALEFRSLRPWVKRNGMQMPRLVNMYGITETTVHVTYRLLTEEDIESVHGSLIGKPIADLTVYLLDGHRQLVPVGVPGEIYVSGAGVARGYLNRPDLTAERFIDDPFRPGSGARMYRSGDLAKWRPDGTLEYLGRNDYQVKIRGFRIEMGEIEAQLLRHRDVKEAVVVAREDESAETRLVAYVIPANRDGAPMTLSAEALRTHLKDLLPDYMIPSAFVRLTAFPLTQNGKLDRKALPAPDQSSVVSAQYVAPRGELEITIAQIFQELLGVAQVGRHDDFFELGGHSLLLVRVMANLQARVGRSPVMAWLYEAPTPAQLAKLMEHRRHDRTWKHLVELREGADGEPLICLSGFHGDLEDFPNIVRYLDPLVPIYGFQLAAAEERQFEQSLDTRIADYEAEVRSLQPHGPYRLCGYSFGGSEAFDLACRLEAQGERVSLILVDAYRPSNWQSALIWLPRMIMHMRGLLRANMLRQRFRDKFRHPSLQPPATLESQLHDRERALIRHAIKRVYTPFRGKVLLVKATKFDPWAFQMHADKRCGWGKYIQGPFEIVRIEAKHLDLMREPFVRSVAAHINKFLDGYLR